MFPLPTFTAILAATLGNAASMQPTTLTDPAPGRLERTAPPEHSELRLKIGKTQLEIGEARSEIGETQHPAATHEAEGPSNDTAMQDFDESALPDADSAANKQTRARLRARACFAAHFGKPVFIRIIKEEFKLELWGRDGDTWTRLKTYDIAGMSGELGPKTREGDCQAPEGFYGTTLRDLNPHSNYHLSFNIGYPNAYDRKLGRTGSLIMIHGSDCSIGCFAMTDSGIEEIYGMVEAALRNGQARVPVQIYPFAMTQERMEAEKDSPHYSFWLHLRPGWEHTEQRHAPYGAESRSD